MYEYKGIVTNVVDGDTLDVTVDLGFKITVKERFRLLAVDTPELKSPDLEERNKAKEVKEYVKTEILDKEITINTEKQGKYGRYLAIIVYQKDGKKINLNQSLVKLGYAKEYQV